MKKDKDVNETLYFKEVIEKIIPNLKVKRIIREKYGLELLKRKRNIKNIRKFYDISEKEEYTLDDKTWNDFDMDKVFGKLDRNYTTLGQGVLYKMLRNPIFNEEKLKNINKKIEFIKNNTKIREKLQYNLINLGMNKKGTLLDMVQSEFKENKSKYYIYTFLGKILPIILFLITIYHYKFGVSLFGLLVVNLYIYEKEKLQIPTQGILYLEQMMKCSKKITHIKEEILEEETSELKAINKRLKKLNGIIKITMINDIIGGVFSFISVMFLLEESAFYKAIPYINKNKKEILNLYESLGKIDAFISIANFKTGLQGIYVEPIFNSDLSLEIEDGYHILLKKGVPNSIHIKDKGIILTGTNMSGKSTFLRMIGINIILAQSFYFTLAKKYNGTFLNVVSSISPSDDLSEGKSFYLSEAESLLRVIKALDKKYPVFCPIDEIFRGTNPIERIAASAEILKYINERNSISIVSTHDRELIDILRDDYNFYYFSESVNNNGLSFDYKLKEGMSTTRNAIKLLEFIGYDKDIVEKAYIRARNIDKGQC